MCEFDFDKLVDVKKKGKPDYLIDKILVDANG